MQEAVKQNAQHLSPEWEKTLKAILNTILARLQATGRNVFDNDDALDIKIGKKGKVTLESALIRGKWTDDDVEKLQTGIEHPPSLEDCYVILSFRGEKNFHAQNGELIQDTLSLVPRLKEGGTEKVPLDLASLEQELHGINQYLKIQSKALDPLEKLPNSETELQSFSELLVKQEEILDSIAGRLDEITKQLQPPTGAVRNWLTQAESKIQDDVLQLRESIRQVFTPRIERLQQQIEERLSVLGKQVTRLPQVDQFILHLLEQEDKYFVLQANRILTSSLGKYDPRDKTINCEIREHVLTWRDKRLSVTRKLDKVEILNDSGFTEAATMQDKDTLPRNLELTTEILEAHNTPHHSQNSSPAHKPRISP